MKEQSSGTSTTLQRSARASASAKTRAVDGRVRRGGDDEVAAVEVGAPVPALQQLDGERRDLRRDLGRDDGHDGAAVEQAARLLVRHPARPDDEHAPALEVDARHVVMLLGHAQTPIEASWTPLRSNRTATSAPPATSAIRYIPGPTTSIRNDSSDRPFSVVSAAETDRAVSTSPAPAGSRRKRRSAACSPPGPVHRSDPARLETELEHPLELRGLLAVELAALDRGDECDKPAAVGLVAGGRQHGLHLAECDLALLRPSRRR